MRTTTSEVILKKLHQIRESAQKVEDELAKHMELLSVEDVLAWSINVSQDACAVITSLIHECDQKAGLLEECKNESELLEKKFKTEINEWGELSICMRRRLKAMEMVAGNQNMSLMAKERKVENMGTILAKYELGINSSKEMCEHYKQIAEKIENTKGSLEEGKALVEEKLHLQLKRMTRALAAGKQKLERAVEELIEEECDQMLFEARKEKWHMDVIIYLRRILTSGPEDRMKSVEEMAFLLGLDDEKVKSLLIRADEENQEEVNSPALQTDHGVSCVDFSLFPGLYKQTFP